MNLHVRDKAIPAALLPVVLLLAAVGLAVTYTLPDTGVDWYTALRPAALEVAQGRSPYDFGFFSPPWTGVFLLPIALLPEQLGRGMLFAVNMSAYGIVLYRLGAKPVAFAAFLASPPVVHVLLNGNIDWLVPLALLLPPRWGVFLATTKIQSGIGLVVYWAIEAWRRGGWREVVYVFWPFATLMLASFVWYGPWPLKMQTRPDLWWNASLWPYAILPGLGLLWLAYRKRDPNIALASSPCFAPYVLFHGYAVMLIPLARHSRWMVLASLALWGVVGLNLL